MTRRWHDWSGGENRHGRHPRRPIDLRVSNLRCARHLAGPGLAPQLAYKLVDLTKPRRSYRFPVCDQATVSVDRQGPADLGCPLLDELLLISVGAKAVLCH